MSSSDVVFLQNELQNQQECANKYASQLRIMQTRLQALSAEKEALLLELIEQKSGFEEELCVLRRKLAGIESERPILCEKQFPDWSMSTPVIMPPQRAPVPPENGDLRLQQTREYEQIISAQQHEMQLLTAKVDAFEFVKADYARLSEEFYTKSRVADSLAKKLAAYTSPPPVDIELLNFQQKIADQLTVYTDALTRAVGWQVRSPVVGGGFILTRGQTEISVNDDFQVTSLVPPVPIPAGVQLPHLLALLTLGDACQT